MSINANPSTLFAREIKVRTLEYKITIFIIALGLFVAWPYLISAWSSYTANQDTHEKLAQQITEKNKKRETIINEIAVLNNFSSEEQKKAIIQCYNTDCQNLPETLKQEPQKTIFKSYLQLQQSTDTKFVIDQKKILSYLNEFLVRSTDGNSTNGEVQGISFGDAQSVEGQENLMRIPMSVTMLFQNKQGLLGFLHNIEQLVSPNFPMLGVVQSVTYDIVKTNEPQEVTILIDIYMLAQ